MRNASAAVRPVSTSSDELLFKKLVDAVQDYAIFMLDPAGHVLTWNQGAERNKGYTAAEIVGRHYSVFFPREAIAQDDPDQHLLQAARDGHFVEDGWRVRKDGTRFWAHVALSAIHDADGTLVGFSKVTRDLTQRRLQDEALRLARDQAEAASRAKSALLANMSHELRTPLNAIIGFSEVLCTDGLRTITDAKRREFAGDILSSGKHLLNLINTILDIARLEAGTEALQFETVPLDELVAEALVAVRPQAAAKVIALETKIAPPNMLLAVDRRRARQMLVNLLSNAVKFTPQGGAVILRAGMADGMIDIVVEDNGIGIDEKDIPLALSSFGQVDCRLDRGHAGTGLGLALVTRLAALHGASFVLNGKADGGTCALLSFRAAPGR